MIIVFVDVQAASSGYAQELELWFDDPSWIHKSDADKIKSIREDVTIELQRQHDNNGIMEIQATIEMFNSDDYTEMLFKFDKAEWLALTGEQQLDAIKNDLHISISCIEDEEEDEEDDF